jgi:hypothetical protein
VNRYGVFSVTGDLGPLTGGSTLKQPTVWYVYDADYMGEIVAQSFQEHVARQEALRLNADERRWEKEQEHAALALRNGRP